MVMVSFPFFCPASRFAHFDTVFTVADEDIPDSARKPDPPSGEEDEEEEKPKKKVSRVLRLNHRSLY